MKRTLAFILSVLLVFASLPLLGLVASADEPQNVLYFSSSDDGPLMHRVSVVPGAEYTFVFSVSNSISNFNISGFDNDSHSTINVSAQEDDSYSVDGKYTRYTYLVTVPSNLATEQGSDKGFMFIGFTFPANTSGYLFDVALYDEEDTNILSNGDFSSGLDHWAWDWDAWFENWSTGIGQTQWNNSATTLKVEQYSDALFKKMIHLVNNGTSEARFAKAVTLTKNHTYRVSFKYELVTGGIGSSIRFNLAFKGATGVSGQCIGDAFSNGDGRYVGAVIDEETRSVSYTFTLQDHEWNNFTYPESREYGVGFLFKENAAPTDIYIGDFSIVDTAAPTVNLFGDSSDYATNLSGWYSGWDAATGTSFTQAGYTATLMNYDAAKFTAVAEEMVEPAAPSRMVYYTNNEKKILGNRFTAVAGKTYYLSFGIASTADIGKISIGAHANGNRNTVSVSPQLISRVDHDTYSWLTYSVTIPANFSADSNMVYIGPNIPANSETYLFNMNIYSPLTVSKTNLFTNKTFETLRYMSIGDWTLIVPSYAYENGTGNSLSINTTEWYNNAQNKVLRAVDYDETAFAGFKKMLYFEFKAAKDFYSRVSATANQSYDFSFNLTNSVQDFSIVTKKDESRNTLSTTKTQISKINHGEYTTYTYRIVMPDSVPSSLAFIGIHFNAGAKGYLFGTNLTVTDDANQSQIFGNGNFGSGLDKWACDWDAWFESFSTGTGYTTWSNANATLTVQTFDSGAFSDVLQKTMLHYYGKVSGNEKSYLGQNVMLTKGHTYAIEFLYDEVEGGLDKTCFLMVAKANANSRPDVPVFGDPKLEDNYQFTKVIDTARKTVKYTFTLTGSRVSSYSETAKYTLTFASTDTTNRSDIYVAEMVMYDTADLTKTSLLPMDDYTTSVGGWGAIWDTAAAGASSFTQQGCTVKFVTFDPARFAFQKQMLYFKEVKEDGFEVFLQKLGTLEANTEYTVSMDYYFKSGAMNDTLYFGIFGGPGDGDMVYKTQYRASKETNLSDPFDTTVDTGKNVTYTFTLTSAEIAANSAYYAGFYLLPDPDMITELYIYDLKLYATSDANQENLFADDAYSTKIRNWVSNYGKSVGSSTVFTRPDIEFTAQYVPLVEEYFTFPDPATHYGDANADGTFNILDLISMKKRASAASPAYFVMADINNDDAFNGDDLTLAIQVLLGAQELGWEEAPITLDTFDLNGGADSAAATRKNTIQNAADSVSVTGTTYYVSNAGSDSNNGRTPSTAFKTIAKVRQLSLSSGDAVLFRRGDTFRTDTRIDIANGVTYSAYGTGAKPKIYGSLKNYADKSIWSTTDGNIWYTTISASLAENVVFNDGESAGVRKTALANLKENGDFYFNSSNNTLYLFMNQANPGSVFSSIEISSAEYLFYAMGSYVNSSYYKKNFTISNLDLRYSATHAMYLAFVQGANINNCAIGWMGGKYLSAGSNARFGNGIEFWRIAKDCTVTNNYIYQVFDSAITFQGTATNQYSGLTITNNLIEYCSMNFEFWAHTDGSSVDPDARMTDILFNNNILRFGGYGFGGAQRVTKSDQAYILTWNADYADGQITNFQIKNNIFDVANSNYFYAKKTDKDLTIANNTYYQTAGSAFQFANGYGDYVTDAATFAAAIAKLDSTPTAVQWVS